VHGPVGGGLLALPVSVPQDTVIDGAIEVFNNLCTAGTQDCNSDDIF
jgi:hypothetical protein